MTATRASTSGCRWGPGKLARATAVASTTALPREDVEAAQGNQVDPQGQGDAGDEQAPEELAVEAQVHEVEGDQGELDHRHRQQERGQRLLEARDVVDGHLDGGDAEQDDG